MTLREKLFKERNTPFFMGNKFFSFTTGEELVISKELKGHYEGYCWIGSVLAGPAFSGFALNVR